MSTPANPSPSVAFDLAYVASRDPRLRVVFNGYFGLPGIAMPYTDRLNLCITLATGGMVVDPQIDADNGDPWGTMTTREQYGYTTVPALLQKLPAVFLPPGITVPGVPSYDPSLWQIKVSTNLADYPKFEDPAPATSYIGSFIGNGLYETINNPQNVFAIGQNYTEGIITYQLIGPAVDGQYFWQFVQKG